MLKTGIADFGGSFVLAIAIKVIIDYVLRL